MLTEEGAVGRGRQQAGPGNPRVVDGSAVRSNILHLDELALEDASGVSQNHQDTPSTNLERAVPEDRIPLLVHPKVREHIERLVCLVYPTVLLSGLCIGIVVLFDIPPDGSEPFLSLLPYPGPYTNESVAIQVWYANANALMIMAFVVFLTYLFVGMFRFRLAFVMKVCVIASFAVSWGGFTGYALSQAAAMDYLTLIVVSLNVAATGVFAVFFVSKDAWIIGNIFLVALGAIISWPFACLPELTVLFFLVWMLIWDMIAVCTPCGPLRYALYIQQKRVWMAEDEFVLPRGMVLRLNLYELGLGDLIFFGVVVARGATVNYETTIACVCAMLASVVFTVIATVVAGQTIPALPIAMIIGIIAYVASRFTFAAFAEGMVASAAAFP